MFVYDGKLTSHIVSKHTKKTNKLKTNCLCQFAF